MVFYYILTFIFDFLGHDARWDVSIKANNTARARGKG
jgi:hypothetical protein